jgi:glutaminase
LKNFVPKEGMKRMQQLLKEIIDNNKHYHSEGKVATYIPELSKARPENLGVAIMDMEGEVYSSGDSNVSFTIQSISKTVTLMAALLDHGEEVVFSKVGMEATGDPFNSIIKLETLRSKPLNPMINAGAIAVASLIKGDNIEQRFERVLELFKKITNNREISLNNEVYLSEKSTGNRNRALGHFMKDYGIIEGDVEEVVDLYFRLCSIEITAVDIANIGALLANNGVHPITGDRIVTRHFSRIVKTLMTTCGMYDASGSFAVRVGIPAKSGVGGGIMAVVPGRMGIGVYGPALDEKGNSVAGIKVLEQLSKKLDLSIF